VDIRAARFPGSPYPLISVVRVPIKIVQVGRLRVSVSTRSGGSSDGVDAKLFKWVWRGRSSKIVLGRLFEGVRANSFGQVIQARARPGKRAHIKNAKL